MTVAAAHIVENSESTEPPLLVVPLVGVTSGKGSLNLYGQNKMRLVNESDSETLVVRRGMMLAGFGRGKWGVKDDNFNEDTMLHYQLSDSPDDVLSNGQDLIPLLDIVLEKQKNNARLSCCVFRHRSQRRRPRRVLHIGPNSRNRFHPHPGWQGGSRSFANAAGCSNPNANLAHNALLQNCVDSQMGAKWFGPSSTSNCAEDRSDNQTRAFSVAELSSLVAPRAHC